MKKNSQKISSGSGGKQVTRGIPTPTTGIVDLIYDNEAKDNRSPHLFSKKTNPYSLGLASPRSDETKLRFFPPNPSDNNLGKTMELVVLVAAVLRNLRLRSY